MKIITFQKSRMLLVAMAFLPILSSCDSFLENDDKFFHVATQEQQWNSLTDTRSALMGIYGLMRAALSENNAYWAYGDLRLGDFTVYKRNDLKAIASNDLRAPFNNVRQLSDWGRFYKVINAACVFMENAGQVLEKDKAYSKTTYNYDMAQARGLRALAYYYMSLIWGDVPLITESYDNGTFPQFARTDQATVLRYVKSEMEIVAEELPFELGKTNDRYYGRIPSEWAGVLMNRLSAYSVLAHLSAWQGNYVETYSYANYILNYASRASADYLSVSELTKSDGLFSTNFNVNKRGARLLAFVYRYVASSNDVDGTTEPTVSGHLEEWTLAEPLVRKPLPDIYVPLATMNKIFPEVTDSRFGYNDSLHVAYTNYVSNFESEIPMFSKVKVVRDGADKTNDYGIFGSAIVLSRLEDILLLKAEALCALNRPQDAIVCLNLLRSNRNLALQSLQRDYSDDTNLLLKGIFDERRREFMGEGHYWFDRVRRARLLSDEPELVKLVNEGGIYWPVSEEVRKANPLIEQTAYWNNKN